MKVPEHESDIVVATYNIHRCVGVDGRRDVTRVGQVLQRVRFDVAALQEVESGEGPNGAPHQLAVLAERTASSAVVGPTIVSADGDYGNALLVRGEVERVERHDLSVRGREPRGLLDVDVCIKGAQLRCLATHLGLGVRERRYQTGKVLEVARSKSERVTVLLGDFNEWCPWVRSRAHLVRHFGKTSMPATFPSRLPLLSLDHIWVRPPTVVKRVRAVDSPLARVASDHLPVVARLEHAALESGSVQRRVKLPPSRV